MAKCLDLNNCLFGERAISYANKLTLPQPKQPNRGFKECCYDNVVLADLGSSESYRNDFNSFFHKRQLDNETCTFELLDNIGGVYTINDNTYGDFVDFGGHSTQEDLTTFRLEWRNVLNLLGAGTYRVRKNINIAGIAFEEVSNSFNLKEFSVDVADKTIRIDAVLDGELVHYGVNFKGTGFEQSLRIRGYFGNRNPKFEQDNIILRNYKAVQISMSQINEYQFQTNFIPVCITEELYDFILFGDELYISDYNKANHSYIYNRFAVELESNKGAKYYPNSRVANIELTFVDRIKNKRKLNC